MEQDLDSKVCEFIDRYIDSVEQLEILLLLKETSPRSWTAPQINEKIQSHLASVQERLAGLCKMNLVACAGDVFAYPGTDSSQDETVAKLASIYLKRRIRVIELIFSRPKNKLRDFSDAFKIRKDPKDG